MSERPIQLTPEMRRERADDIVPELLYHVATPRNLNIFAAIPKHTEVSQNASQIAGSTVTSTASRVLNSFSEHNLVQFSPLTDGYLLTQEGSACRDRLISAAESLYALHPEIHESVLGRTTREIKSAIRVLRAIHEEETTLPDLAKKLELPKGQVARTIERLQNTGVLSPSEVLEIPEEGLTHDILTILIEPLYGYVATSSDFDRITPNLSKNYNPTAPEAVASMRRQQDIEHKDAEFEARIIAQVSLSHEFNDDDAAELLTTLQDETPTLMRILQKDSGQGINILTALHKRGNRHIDSYVKSIALGWSQIIGKNFSYQLLHEIHWAKRYYDIAESLLEKYGSRDMLTQLDILTQKAFSENETTLCESTNKRQMIKRLLTYPINPHRDFAVQFVENHLDDYFEDQKSFYTNDALIKAFPYMSELSKDNVRDHILRIIKTRNGQDMISIKTLLETCILDGAIEDEEEIDKPTQKFVKNILSVFDLDSDFFTNYWKDYRGDGETYQYAIAKNLSNIIWLEAQRKNPEDTITKTLFDTYGIVHFRRWAPSALIEQYRTRDVMNKPQIIFIYRHADYVNDASTYSLDQAISSRKLKGEYLIRGYEAERGVEVVKIIDDILASGQQTPYIIINAHGDYDHIELGLGSITGDISIGMLRERRFFQRLKERWAGKFTLVLASCFAAAETNEEGESVDTNIAQRISQQLGLRVIAGEGLSYGVYFPTRFGPPVPKIRKTPTILYENGQKIREIL